MNQEFVEKLNACRDRKSLALLKNDLDVEKRKLKIILERILSEPPEKGGLTGIERTRKARLIRKKISYLVEEREAVFQKLCELKKNKSALNSAAHRKKGFCEAFVAAAERTLSQEDFLELELKAAEILICEKGEGS